MIKSLWDNLPNDLKNKILNIRYENDNQNASNYLSVGGG